MAEPVAGRGGLRAFSGRETSERHRRIASWRTALVVSVAAATPAVWLVAHGMWREGWPAVPSMTLSSVAYWTLGARALRRLGSGAHAVAAALVLGAASPFLGCVLAWLIALVLLLPIGPLVVLYVPAAMIFTAPFFGAALVVVEWRLFVPVGVGMGLFVLVTVRGWGGNGGLPGESPRAVPGRPGMR